MIALLLLFTSIFVIIICWCKQQIVRDTDFLKTVPQPVSNLPILGVALDFKSAKDLLPNLTNYIKTYGDLITGRIGPFRKILLIADYPLLEFVLSSTKLITKSNEYYFLRPWLGDGLLTSDGQKWKNHRRILTPAFHFQILPQFVDIFDRCSNTLLKKFNDNVDKSDFDIYPLVTLYTLDVICESIMGISINAQNNNNSKYVRSVKNMCRIIVERGLSPIQMYDFLYVLTKNYKTQQESLNILHKQSNDVVYARRKELENNSKINTDQKKESRKKKPFLDLLLQANDNGTSLTHNQIREEVDTFMFEGHDTTGSAVSFALYCLAKHPEVQEKALQEQKEIFQNQVDVKASYNDLQEMKYLELVIKETLRLYPSVPVFAREVKEDIEFEDKLIPKGLTLIIFPFGVHRNPKYFKDPEKFLPERFDCRDDKLPYAYIPFSAGPRNCIGQKFAMLELKCTLSKILRNFELLPAVSHPEPELLAEAILKSSNGIHIRVKPRNHNL